jgi:hypothetical protein
MPISALFSISAFGMDFQFHFRCCHQNLLPASTLRLIFDGSILWLFAVFLYSLMASSSLELSLPNGSNATDGVDLSTTCLLLSEVSVLETT